MPGGVQRTVFIHERGPPGVVEEGPVDLPQKGWDELPGVILDHVQHNSGQRVVSVSRRLDGPADAGKDRHVHHGLEEPGAGTDYSVEQLHRLIRRVQLFALFAFISLGLGRHVVVDIIRLCAHEQRQGRGRRPVQGIGTVSDLQGVFLGALGCIQVFQVIVV